MIHLSRIQFEKGCRLLLLSDSFMIREHTPLDATFRVIGEVYYTRASRRGIPVSALRHLTRQTKTRRGVSVLPTATSMEHSRYEYIYIYTTSMHLDNSI